MNSPAAMNAVYRSVGSAIRMTIAAMAATSVTVPKLSVQRRASPAPMAPAYQRVGFAIPILIVPMAAMNK